MEAEESDSVKTGTVVLVGVLLTVTGLLPFAAVAYGIYMGATAASRRRRARVIVVL